jgi:hypothetical protein
MPRQALHSDDIKIEQKPDIAGDAMGRRPEIVRADTLDKDYADALAFAEEPVTIRLEPSTDKNAASFFPIWNNGKGCEVLIDDAWREMAYIPVGQVVTIKRKYLEIIVRAKIDTVATEVRELESETPNNVIKRFTSAVHSFSIIEDRNPRGAAWLTEIRRRNM